MINCGVCDYMRVVEGHAVCKRYPPQVVLVPVQTLSGQGLAIQPAYPPVKDDDFCGEFKVVPLKGV